MTEYPDIKQLKFWNIKTMQWEILNTFLPDHEHLLEAKLAQIPEKLRPFYSVEVIAGPEFRASTIQRTIYEMLLTGSRYVNDVDWEGIQGLYDEFCEIKGLPKEDFKTNYLKHTTAFTQTIDPNRSVDNNENQE